MKTEFKKAVITGVSGQDGTYLTKYLIEMGYFVFGVDKRNFDFTHERFKLFLNVDLTNYSETSTFLSSIIPDEIYHLATSYYSSEDSMGGELAFFSAVNKLHCDMTLTLLEWIRCFGVNTKFFFPSSCYVFGGKSGNVQNENSPRDPVGMYGITKNVGEQLCRHYRANYNLFVAVGILYNHESPIRFHKFVSRKIVQGAIDVRNKNSNTLVLGDMNVEVDWGFAGDYVVAMHKILQYEQPEDFIVSSGEKHALKEFVSESFSYLGLDWERHVVIDKALLKTCRKSTYFGDNTKLVENTGWSNKTSLKKLVKIMVDAELKSGL